MVDVAHGRKQNPILLIGVLGVALALLALVWLLGGIGGRTGDFATAALDSSADLPAATTPSTGADWPRAPREAPEETLPLRTSSEDRSALLARPLRGTVVDERTREPVPFVDVHLWCGALDETVQTGRDGAFRSTREFTEDKLTAIVSDAGFTLRTLVREKHARGDEPWILEVPIGPTYPLAIDAALPIDPAQWTACVIETTRNFENAGEIEVDERGLTMSAPLAGMEHRAWPSIPLRAPAILAGDIPWCRFPAVKFDPDARYRLRIQLRCESLGLKGLGRIRSTVGVQDPVIVDGLKSFGVLQGKIVDANGVAVSGATVLLLPRPVGPDDFTPEWSVTQANEKGEFRLADLVLGQRELVAFAPKERALFLRGIVVPAGVTVLEDPFRLPKNVSLPDFEGVADVAAEHRKPGPRRPGREKFYAHIRLPYAGRFVRDWVQAVTDASILDHDARLDAARLPSASLDVEWLDLLESRARVRPPVGPTQMSIADPKLKLKLEYAARDGRELRFDIEGEEDQATNLDVSFEPGGALIGEQNLMELRRWLLGRGARFRWIAWRRGCAPIQGDEDQFQEKNGKLVSMPLRFRPGWGAVLWCRTTDGMPSENQRMVQALGYAGETSTAIPLLHEVLASPPLPGVRVLVDGTLGGTSDDEGVLYMKEPTLPARLVLVADHWHMVRLERLPQRCASTQRYVAWMERD
jgi:hypothetical protein